MNWFNGQYALFCEQAALSLTQFGALAVYARIQGADEFSLTAIASTLIIFIVGASRVVVCNTLSATTSLINLTFAELSLNRSIILQLVLICFTSIIIIIGLYLLVRLEDFSLFMVSAVALSAASNEFLKRVSAIKGRYSLFFYNSVLYPLAFLFCNIFWSLTFGLEGLGAHSLVFSYVVAQCSAAFCYSPSLRERLTILPDKQWPDASIRSFAIYSLLGYVLYSIMNSVGTLSMSILLSSAAFSMLVISRQAYQPVHIVYLAWDSRFRSFLAKCPEGQAPRMRAAARSSLIYLIGFALLYFVLLFISADYFFYLLYGNEFREAGVYVIGWLPATLLLALSQTQEAYFSQMQCARLIMISRIVGAGVLGVLFLAVDVDSIWHAQFLLTVPLVFCLFSAQLMRRIRNS